MYKASQINIQAVQQQSFTPVRSGLLQRTRSFAQHTSGEEDCTSSSKKHEGTLQRAAINTTPTSAVPPIVHEGSRFAQMPVSTHHTGAMMQRAEDAGATQDDKIPAQAGGVPATSGATPATPAQAPTPSTWTTDLLAIILDSDRQDCFGMATPSATDPYSNCGSPVRPPFCQSARVPFSVDFLVDRAGTPRPSSLKMPTVSVDFDFVTTGGNRTKRIQQTDAAPRYNGPNMPLKTSFGQDFPIGTNESGTLHVQLTMNDTASGVRFSYIDDINFDIRPCT